MSLLGIYLTALIIGGVLLVVSLVMGGKDAHGHDEGHDHGHDHGHFDLLAWFPITSLRFWTFFMAGAGAVGTVCTVAGAGVTPSGVAAVAVGYLSGWGFVSLVRRLQRGNADSSLSEKDYIGANARVITPVGPEQTGKVRLQLKGRTIELLADTDEKELIGERQQVTVYALKENGNVLVTRSERLADDAVTQ